MARLSRSLRRAVLGGIVAVLAVGLLAVAMRDETSDTERIAAMPRELLELDHVTLTQRSSLRQPDGTVKYSDSSAILALVDDRAHVDLPDVIRNGTLQLVSQGLSLYVSVPADLAGRFGPARWLRVDTGSRAEARGAHLGAVPDPATVMLAIAGATGTVTDSERKLDGRGVRVRRVNVEPRLMARRVGADYVASANVLGRISLRWTAEVWIGTDGRPRRIVLRATGIEGAPRGTRLTLDLRLSRFDQETTIGIPPDDAVHTVGDMPSALELLGAA